MFMPVHSVSAAMVGTEAIWSNHDDRRFFSGVDCSGFWPG